MLHQGVVYRLTSFDFSRNSLNFLVRGHQENHQSRRFPSYLPPRRIKQRCIARSLKREGIRGYHFKRFKADANGSYVDSRVVIDTAAYNEHYPASLDTSENCGHEDAPEVGVKDSSLALYQQLSACITLTGYSLKISIGMTSILMVSRRSHGMRALSRVLSPLMKLKIPF